MLRTSAVRRVVASESLEDAAKDLGINRRPIYRWQSIYAVGGAEVSRHGR
jgi:hypothetical protein